MDLKRWYWLPLLAFIYSTCFINLAGQPSEGPEPKAYYFEGDEVIFEFDIRWYKDQLEDVNKEAPDFADFNLYDVYVSGKFNNWSVDDWRMEKVSPYRFKLRKKIADCDDPFEWEFKFVVGGKYWVDPVINSEEKIKVQQTDFWKDVFGMDLYPVSITPEGNARFVLDSFPDANRVILSGTFNGWSERQLLMRRTESGWGLTLELPPGRYEYKFIVDGQWMHDPMNEKVVSNQHGTLNSVLNIQVYHTFVLKDFPNAQKVVLAGTFNNWNVEHQTMIRHGDQWETTLQLYGGKHLYKFIVDGKWLVDPDNPFKEYDRDGNINSVLILQ